VQHVAKTTPPNASAASKPPDATSRTQLELSPNVSRPPKEVAEKKPAPETPAQTKPPEQLRASPEKASSVSTSPKREAGPPQGTNIEKVSPVSPLANPPAPSTEQKVV